MGHDRTRDAAPVSGAPGKDESNRSGCHVEIHIDTNAPVNIYNCSAPPAPCESPPEPGPSAPCGTSSGPLAPGQCIPLAIGSKPKQSLRTKLDALLQHAPVASAVAAAFFQHARRFAAGRVAANPFEAQAFDLFRSMPADLRSILACSVASFDGIPRHDRNRLFDPAIPQDPDVPLGVDAVAAAFVRELKQRVGIQAFGHPDALDQERPGRNRFFDTTGSESFEVQLRICTVNGLRTNEYAPPLRPGDYLPGELQVHCVPNVVNGTPQPSCSVQQGNCPGNFLSDGTCLRVPDVRAGDGIVLEGVNFISIDAKVRLTALGSGSSIVRDVDAFVYGDLDTPLEETVDGATRVIRDCRVHDRLSFVMPPDLPSGVYGIQVVLPNVTGFPVFGNQIVSNMQFVRLSPPPTARFRISSEMLVCRGETAPAAFGSDEVRVRVRAYPVIANLNELTLGDEQAYDSPEFGDVDSHEDRPMVATLFDQPGLVDGVFLTIMAFEIDSERAYREQIDSFTDAFLHYLKITLKILAGAITAGAVAMGAKELLAMALAHPVILAIAAAVVLVVLLVLAAWAPADLLIEDALAFTLADLDDITNGNLPMPVIGPFTTQQGLKVTVAGIEKGPLHYKEYREYHSTVEDSWYGIRLRYDRIA